MFSFFLKMSWRNIWRNKRRTLLTVNAIGFGVMALVAMQNYYDGFHEQVIRNLIRYQSGHLVITAPGYYQQYLPQLFMTPDSRIMKWLRTEPALENLSQRINVQGLMSSAKGSSNVLLTGVFPEQEKKVTRYAENIIKGKYLDDKTQKGIVIGSRLAKILKVSLGAKVVVLTQGIDGSIGNELFLVSGIFETQSEADRSIAFIHIQDARSLLSMPKDAIHQLAVTVKSQDKLDEVKAGLIAALKPPKLNKKKARKRLPLYQVQSWKDIQKPLLAMFELNRTANDLLMYIILFVAALGIANSILMSILERTREFGVMMTMGTYRSEVVILVLAETIWLSLIGVILGNLLGIGITLYFGEHGFDLSWFTKQSVMIAGQIVETMSYPVVHWKNSIRVSATILVLTLIVSAMPIRYILKLKPLDAIRNH